MIAALPLWLFTHFLADYFMGQNDWASRNKGKLWIVMTGHAAAYAAAFAVTGATNDWLVLTILFLTHLVIDPIKTRWRLTQRLFHWMMPWNVDEVREYLERSSKPFHEADASKAAIESREYRLEGFAMYLDQALHIAVVVGLFFSRGQGWEIL